MLARLCLISLCALMALVCASATGQTCSVVASHLRTEGQFSPATGIDEPQPLLSWRLSVQPNSTVALNLSQSQFQIQCATAPALLETNTPDLWAPAAVISNNSLLVPYAGVALSSFTIVFWRVRIWDGLLLACPWSTVAQWEMALVPALAPWQGQWITSPPLPAPPATASESDCPPRFLQPTPLFRATVPALTQSIVRARFVVAGLGYFRVFVNNALVDASRVLDPPWTDFNTTINYVVHDITSMFAPNETTVLGVELGNGWFNLLPLQMWGSKIFGDALPQGTPMMRAQLHVWFANGSSAVLAPTGVAPWLVGASGTLFNSVYLGARHDARLDPANWSAPSFVPGSGWVAAPAVQPASIPGGVLRAMSIPPIRKQSVLSATESHATSDGATVYDFGKNMAGICTVTAIGAAGSSVVTRFGELLESDGTLNGLTSAAGQIKSGNGGPCAPPVAYQTDTFILAGLVTDEVWESPFTWHGFQFVEVRVSGGAVLRNITCAPLRTDVRVVGEFRSVYALLNSIHALNQNTCESNMMSVQSDCPHRERLGYGGDALMSGETFMSLFDMEYFYAKRFEDYMDAQRPGGGLTETAPFVGISDASLGGASGPVGWQTFGPVDALWLYTHYGATRHLLRYFDNLLAYVEFLDAAPAAAIENSLGDWMAIETKALPLTGRAFQIQSYEAFAAIALLTGNTTWATTYSSKALALRASVNQRFFDANTGVYRNTDPAVPLFNATQCGQSLPLWLGLCPLNATTQVVQVLLDNLASVGNHLQVGGFGVKYLLMALADNDHQDVAFDIMTQLDFPSFGYMLNNNATTIWESWFFSDNTYSHNHPMFSSGEVWLMQTLGGIRIHPQAVGFDKVIIKPMPIVAIPSVNASLDTVRGPVTTLSSWSAQGNFEFYFSIPPNMQAFVDLPLKTPGLYCLTPGSAGAPPSTQLTGTVRDMRLQLQVGSGSYKFRAESC